MLIIAPHPFGIHITLPQLQQLFTPLQQHEERYRQLIRLAQQLPSLPESYKVPRYQLRGCVNQVWLGYQSLPDGRLHFFADSDGRIVRGVIAILLTAVEGKSAQQIQQYDLLALLQELGIQQQLGSSRALGVSTIIEAIQQAGKSGND